MTVVTNTYVAEILGVAMQCGHCKSQPWPAASHRSLRAERLRTRSRPSMW
jgi:bacterioferritin-associated ferredoxin